MSAGDEKMRPTPGQLQHCLDCFVSPNGRIDIELRTATESLAKWVMDTRDQAIREALIKLGWTPPPDNHKLQQR